MDVSLHGGTPQNTPKWSFLVGKPIVVGYHHFRKPPYTLDIYIYIQLHVCSILPRHVSMRTLGASEESSMVSKRNSSPQPIPWILACLTRLVAEERKSGSTILGMEYTMIHQHVWEVVPFFGFFTHRRIENLRTSPMKSSIFDIGICFLNHRSSNNWKQISNVKCQATPWQWRWSSQQLREVLRGGAFDLGGVEGHDVMKFGCCHWEVGKSLHPKDHWTLMVSFWGPYPCVIQVQTLPLEGPRSLGHVYNL